MSVPLDRLYHYLENLIQEDMLIYRFYPHGSKKLEDLIPLVTEERSWLTRAITPMLIFHDQEPLYFDLYNFNDVQSKLPFPTDSIELIVCEEMFEFLNIQVGLTSPLNRIHDYGLLCHSEKNSKNLKLYEDKHFIGVYWWSHALIARDWFRYAEHDTDLAFDINKITNDFLIYSRAWLGTREYRLKLADLLIDYNLVDNCRTTVAFADGNNYYLTHEYENTRFKPMHRLEDYFKENITDSHASADYESLDYQTTGIEVVLETLFDDERLHLTEKSLRPIACGRPFILTATPGSLQYLREYGFKTFNGLIDETYDEIIDPVERLIAIVKEMKRISNLDPTAKLELYNKLYQIAAENKKLFFSTSWQESIVNEFRENFQNAYRRQDQHKTGKWSKHICNFVENDNTLYKKFYIDTPYRTLDDMKKLLAMVPSQQISKGNNHA